MLFLSSGVTVALNGFVANENRRGIKGRENMRVRHKNNYNRQILLTATCDMGLNLCTETHSCKIG